MNLDSPFSRAPIPVYRDGGITNIKFKDFMLRDGLIKFYFRRGRRKSESRPLCETYIQHKFETIYQTLWVYRWEFVQGVSIKGLVKGTLSSSISKLPCPIVLAVTAETTNPETLLEQRLQFWKEELNKWISNPSLSNGRGF